MTVKELREKLASVPDDLLVFVDGYEGGVQEPGYIGKALCALNVAIDGYCGDHEEIDARYGEDAALLDAQKYREDGKAFVLAMLIGRRKYKLPAFADEFVNK